MNWSVRVRAAFDAASRPSPEDDVIVELAQHAAALHDAALASGRSPEDAANFVAGQIDAWVAQATDLRRPPGRSVAPAPPPGTDDDPWRLGEPPAPGARTSARVVPARHPRATTSLLGWSQDVRYAMRLLARERSHSSLVIATMALGIAATTVLFSVLYGVLLKPLPWAESDRLVRVTETRQGGMPRVKGTMSNGTYLAWRERHSTIEDIGGWMSQSMTLTGVGDPERLRIGVTTASLLAILGGRPAHGRLFTAADETAGHVVMLSEAFWRSRFGASSSVVGRTIQLDRQSRTVIGVMDGSFVFPDRDVHAWVPFAVPTVMGGEGIRRLSIFPALARLRRGATIGQAAAEATSRGRAAPDPGIAGLALFGSQGPVEVSVIPALDAITAEVRPAITVLFAAVIVLLVTAAANVASLQLARAATRRRDLAIRSALGAGAGRLSRQLLVESLLLGLTGGLTGVALAYAIVGALPMILPDDFPRVEAITVDGLALLFAVTVSLLAGAACSVLPALHVRRSNLVEALNEDGLAPVGLGLRTRTARTRAAIIVGQVAAACVLLVAAALLARSFLALQRADRGYDPSGTLTVRIPLRADYPVDRRTQVLEGVTKRVAPVPGVEAVAYANTAPLMSVGGFTAFAMRPPQRPETEVMVEAAQRVVSPGYFSALRLRVRQGRALAESDRATSAPVVVVNRSFAQRYLGDSPVGARIPWQGPRAGARLENDAAGWDVVGVVDDVRHGAVDAAAQPEIYVAFAQVDARTLNGFDPILVVRTSGDPLAIVPTLRTALGEQDPSLALDAIMTMDERIASSLARPRTYAAVLGGFASFSVIIAGIGLFGGLAYSVTQRAREIGVRTALGATPRAIVALVLKQAGTLVVAGVASGLVLAVALGRALASLLFGVTPRDAVSFGTVVVVLLAVAGLASIVPARRAARVDPLTVLK